MNNEKLIIFVVIFVIGYLIYDQSKPKMENFGVYSLHTPLKTIKWEQNGELIVDGHQNCNVQPLLEFTIPGDFGSLDKLILKTKTEIPINVVGEVRAEIRLNNIKIGCIKRERKNRTFDLTYLLQSIHGSEYLIPGDQNTITIHSCTHYVPIRTTNSILTMTYHVSP
tara:strand:- start:4374 stop:4874 length:501 start_codon:yes stop_codon:yes gene_type:complete